SLLAELQSTEGNVERTLDPKNALNAPIEKMTIDKATGDAMHTEIRMASEKLAEGIDGFTKALESLEGILSARLAVLEG
ncbi:MAG: transaldolase, partial [Methylobacter sp.]|nr:transaldolase [Methylobacter sp.]